MLTIERLNEKGYIANTSDMSIEEVVYRDYLRDYGGDETTSPRGVEPRIHIREVECNNYLVEGVDFDNEDEAFFYCQRKGLNQDTIMSNVKTMWEVWTWGTGGNNPRKLTSHPTEEYAEIDLYEHFEYYIQNKNWNAPIFFDTRKEAIQELADSRGKPFEVIERYINYKEKCEAKAREQVIIEEELRRQAKLNVEAKVITEAETIVIDDTFIEEAKEARVLPGLEKSQAQSKAFVALINRNGKEKIESDFWKVFRIINAKIKG